MKRTPLWLRIGLIMSALAICSGLAVVGSMYLYYWVGDYRVQQSMSVADRELFHKLLTDVPGNRPELWRLFEKYYDINTYLPGVTNNADLLALAIFAILLVPITVALGFIISRPLKSRFGTFTRVAHKVAAGDFSARVPYLKHESLEVHSLTGDFNRMVERLEKYEQHVKDSNINLAHELRTPLNAALGRVQGMMDEVFPLSKQQLLLVQSQLHNLNSLVGDLHLLSLANSGSLHMTLSRFSLSLLIKDRLAWFAPQFKRLKICVQCQLDSDYFIDGDPVRIGQLLNILIENSIKYGASGKELEVVVSEAMNNIKIEFLDRGPGVVCSDLEIMFERFWRAEPSRARTHGGGGLGLSIARVICDAHGGCITAHSRSGGGLALKVTLPRYQDALSHVESP